MSLDFFGFGLNHPNHRNSAQYSMRVRFPPALLIPGGNPLASLANTLGCGKRRGRCSEDWQCRSLCFAAGETRQYYVRMGFSETIFLFFLALLIFGPKKLPEIARQVGKALNEFKRASNEFKSQIASEISQLELENQRQILPPAEPPAGAVASATAPEPTGTLEALPPPQPHPDMKVAPDA